MGYRDSEKYIEALNTLDDELKPIFEEFVSDYRYAATARHGLQSTTKNLMSVSIGV